MLACQVMFPANKPFLKEHCISFQDSVFSKRILVEECGKYFVKPIVFCDIHLIVKSAKEDISLHLDFLLHPLMVIMDVAKISNHYQIVALIFYHVVKSTLHSKR